MEEIIGKTLRRGKETIGVDTIINENPEFIGIYFGAHWAPPCRLFTPALADFHNKINGGSSDQKKIEIIFCSNDGNDAAFERNYAEMPFDAIPYSDEQRIQNLKQRFGINGIPTLVVLDKRGETVSYEGRVDI